MIGFFRKIRKKLADDNQFLKYSRYAVGEILLVVIGILIALQVNNWNEDRKSRAYEKLLLNELKISLENDVHLIEFLLERMETKKKAMDNFLAMLHEGETLVDSIMMKNYGELRMGVEMTYDKGAYESLKSKGIELIRDEELRKHIVQLYEVTYPRIEVFIDSYYQLNYDRSKSTRFKFEDIAIEKGSDSTYMAKISLDYKNLLSNPDFKQFIRVEQDEYFNNKGRVEWALREASMELDHIKRTMGEEVTDDQSDEQ